MKDNIFKVFSKEVSFMKGVLGMDGWFGFDGVDSMFDFNGDGHIDRFERMAEFESFRTVTGEGLTDSFDDEFDDDDDDDDF